MPRLEGVGHLADDVAHDFNNLLAAILNYVSHVSEAISTELDVRPAEESGQLHEMLDDVSQMGAAAERAAHLLDRLRSAPDRDRH
jgi:signal transduction histidine kinase